MTPRVSVVVATRNRRSMLARALASVAAQDFRGADVVVVDDGSTDGTAEWLRAEHPAVQLVALPLSQGAAAARNRGVERASGDIVAFLDDDDAWRPSYLTTQVAQLDAHPDAWLSSTGHVEVDAGGRVSWPDLRPVFDYPSPLVHLMAECPLHTLSVVTCRRAAFARVGPFDESLTIVHDLDWYLRLVAGGGRLIHHPAALVERSMPGGLVTRQRVWCSEEREAHRRVFATGSIGPHDRRRIRASRALHFARVALAKGDVGFASARLVEALLESPSGSVRIAWRRWRRRQRREERESWSGNAWETR